MVVRLPDWCLPQYRFRCFINSTGVPVAISQYHHDCIYEEKACRPEAVLNDLLPALEKLKYEFKAVIHRFNSIGKLPTTTRYSRGTTLRPYNSQKGGHCITSMRVGTRDSHARLMFNDCVIQQK